MGGNPTDCCDDSTESCTMGMCVARMGDAGTD
jgi:hypothetical protein